MPDSHHTEVVDVVERPISISRLVRTLGAYAPIILLSWFAVAIAYVVIAIAMYIFAPVQRVTGQKFRLDFKGATLGQYPNGLNFSASDIVSTPILLQVYRDNQLDRFTSFANFSRSLFVLASNPDYERLAADYQARLSDPRISAIDRERIQREWESRASAISKNDYTINFMRTPSTAAVPESIARKVLLDTLADWATYARVAQHGLDYQLSVLSPDIVAGGDSSAIEPIVALQMLRAKINRVQQNIDDMKELPGALLVRSTDGMSLEEIRFRLEEIVRFRLEPLTGRAVALSADRASAIRFIESQLSYDTRELKARQASADALRDALAVYEQRNLIPEAGAVTTSAAPPRQKQAEARGSETLMPQLSDSFIDRLVALTSKSADVEYRQKLVDDYRHAALTVGPLQQAVAYDQQLVELVKSGGASAVSQPGDVRNEIASIRSDVRQLVASVNDIYAKVSRNLSASTGLYTITAPPVARTERSRSLSRLALYGVLIMGATLPVIVAACLLHARVREEEEDETFLLSQEAETV